jgi:hypothetical protein
MTGKSQILAVENREIPIVCGFGNGLLPHQPCNVVDDRAVPVVRVAFEIRRAGRYVRLTIGYRPLGPTWI